jgi:Zn-dependent peptidase ImmA (M78 family)
MTDTVPALPEPERIAQRVLLKANFTRPPISLDRVVNSWSDLSVVEQDLDGSGYLLPLGKHGAEIVVNRADPPERQRFTIAHELGHWVLGLIWQQRSGQFQQPHLPHGEVEKWCDSFASSLLMPNELVKPLLSGWDKPSFIDGLLRARQTFNVSEPALFIRVWELGKIQVAILKRPDPRCGEFEVQQSFADPEHEKELKTLLQMPEVQTQIQMGDPLVLFSGTGRVRSFRCSGRRLNANRVILAIGWEETGSK